MSGATATGQSHRERNANLKEAFQGIVKNPKFKVWYNTKIQEILQKKTVEQAVEENLKDENLRIEIRENGRWIVAEQN